MDESKTRKKVNVSNVVKWPCGLDENGRDNFFKQWEGKVNTDVLLDSLCLPSIPVGKVSMVERMEEGILVTFSIQKDLLCIVGEKPAISYSGDFNDESVLSERPIRIPTKRYSRETLKNWKNREISKKIKDELDQKREIEVYININGHDVMLFSNIRDVREIDDTIFITVDIQDDWLERIKKGGV
jgi:hypothetical protein